MPLEHAIRSCKMGASSLVVLLPSEPLNGILTASLSVGLSLLMCCWRLNARLWRHISSKRPATSRIWARISSLWQKTKMEERGTIRALSLFWKGGGVLLEWQQEQMTFLGWFGCVSMYRYLKWWYANMSCITPCNGNAGGSNVVQ